MANLTADGDPTTTSTPGVWACLRYQDAKAAIAFLVEAFGFETAFVVPGTDDRQIPHAELLWPEGGGVMLGSNSFTAGVHAQLPVGAGSTYVVCADPVAVHARAVAADAEIVEGLGTTDYGSLGFTARDPEGNHWSFGTYPGTLATAE
ncbi:MAG TPA: VOC family protein [Acidimicrobiales bacterium]|jgi:uncharacterized glyoxalase superfamily protein PhnB